jgi:hypothetical protein
LLEQEPTIWAIHPAPAERVEGRQQLRIRCADAGNACNPLNIENTHGRTATRAAILRLSHYMPLSPRVRAYFMGGGGGAIRRISLTQTIGNGGPYCFDWTGLCSNGGYPGDVLVDSRTTGRWEWNAGAELNFPLGGTASLFVEARYMEVETPVPTRFVPIRFGISL